jgi:hypothetical protein
MDELLATDFLGAPLVYRFHEVCQAGYKNSNGAK